MPDGAYPGGNKTYTGSAAYGLQPPASQGPVDPSAYGWNPEQDYRVWDDPETITYTSHGTNYPGDAVLGQLSPVFRYELSFKEMAASGGVYTTQDRRFTVPDQLVRPWQLKPADFFRDFHGVQWTVLSTDYDVQESNWELTCRNLVLAHQLYDLVTIQTCKNTEDAAGVRTPGYTSTYTNVPARIQEQDGEERDERGKRLTVRRYTVYLGQRVIVSNEDRLLDASNNVYEIKSYSRPDLITDLMELHVERRGW